MEKLSLNKAAKEAGVAKSTLLEALKKGRLSANKNEKGHWEIEPSELFRVYPKTTSEPSEEPKPTPTSSHIETSILQAKLDMMGQRLEDAQETIGDLRSRLDAETAERRETQRMLTHMTGQKTEQPKGLFKRLFG